MLVPSGRNVSRAGGKGTRERKVSGALQSAVGWVGLWLRAWGL